MDRKGQAALEILVIFGVLVIGAVIFSVFYLNSHNKNLNLNEGLSDSATGLQDRLDYTKETNPSTISCGNQFCEVGEDCQNCEIDCGVCVPVVDLCENGELDDGEITIDCGGTCPVCLPGQCQSIGTAAFDPVDEVFTTPIYSTISYTDPNCLDYNIFYTTDYTVPTNESFKYESPIFIDKTILLRAVVSSKDQSNSVIYGSPVEKYYEINLSGCNNALGVPTFTPVGGIFSTFQNVSLSYVDSNCSDYNIYFTADGSEPTLDSNLYVGEIMLASTTKLTAKVFAKNFSMQDVNGSSVTQEYVITGTITTPVANPGSGTYNFAQSVALSATPADAAIYYTTNGSEPTQLSTKYIGAIPINVTTTLKAKAFKDNWAPSSTMIASYVISQKVVTPISTPFEVCKIYTAPVSVSLSTTTSSAMIRYTIDGTEPTIASSLYSAPIVISTTKTLKAKAFRTGWTASDTITRIYRVETGWNYCSPVNGVYHLSQPAHLNCIRLDLDGNYVLDNDIDLTGINFEPIGAMIPYDSTHGYCGFVGYFDGQGYSIRNLYINRPSDLDVGLFGYVGTYSYQNNIGSPVAYQVKNLVLKDISVSGLSNVGGLIGRSRSGYLSIFPILNISGNGVISGNSNVGGLVGDIDGGSIINSNFSGSVSGNYKVGGLIGGIYNGGILQNSNFSGNVSGQDETGGLVGSTTDAIPNQTNFVYGSGQIKNSHSSGTVSGNAYVGGIVGRLAAPGFPISSGIETSYSTSNVSGTDYVGGLVGVGTLFINNNYAIGNVTRKSGSTSILIGGLIGATGTGMGYALQNNYSTGRVIYTDAMSPTDRGFSGNLITGSVANYWDTITSQQSTSPSNAFGKTTTEMKKKDTFESKGWDFTNIWTINSTMNNGYPYLRNNLPQ